MTVNTGNALHDVWLKAQDGKLEARSTAYQIPSFRHRALRTLAGRTTRGSRCFRKLAGGKLCQLGEEINVSVASCGLLYMKLDSLFKSTQQTTASAFAGQTSSVPSYLSHDSCASQFSSFSV
eukprot:341423-Amphidinium_carterae.1